MAGVGGGGVGCCRAQRVAAIPRDGPSVGPCLCCASARALTRLGRVRLVDGWRRSMAMSRALEQRTAVHVGTLTHAGPGSGRSASPRHGRGSSSALAGLFADDRDALAGSWATLLVGPRSAPGKGGCAGCAGCATTERAAARRAAAGTAKRPRERYRAELPARRSGRYRPAAGAPLNRPRAVGAR